MPIWNPNLPSLGDRARRDGSASNRSLSQRLSEIGDEPAHASAGDGHEAAEGPPPSRRDLLLRSLWQRAIDGDLGAARLIFEYCDGRPERSRSTGYEPLAPITADDLAAAMAGAPWELSRPGPHRDSPAPAQPQSETIQDSQD